MTKLMKLSKIFTHDQCSAMAGETILSLPPLNQIWSESLETS